MDFYEGSEKQGFIFHSDSKAGVEQSQYSESMQTGYVQVTYRCSKKRKKPWREAIHEEIDW